MEEVDVLVVGAGPCGLMLANELGRRGIHTLLADMDRGIATEPRANATQARSMEHYRRHGLADRIRALGLPSDYPTDVSYFTTYAGYELARHPMPPSGMAAEYIRKNEHIWNSAEAPHRVPQSLVEGVLWEQAGRYESVRIEFEWELTGLDEQPDRVIAHLVHVGTGEERKVRARFLFGADGTRSAVRRKLGIRYSGGDVAARDFMGGRMLSIYLSAPAFYDVVKAPHAWMYWTFNSRRRGLLAAIDGRGEFVFQTQLRDGEKAEEMSAEQASALFLQAVGREIPVTVTGVAQWLAGRALVADSFGAGRVWMGGDAVHIFTPTGGMGYNTAIEDAVNIGWKLAAVLRGQGAEELLASYEAERRPVAIRNTRFALEFADSVGLYKPSAAIEEEGPEGRAARRRAGAYLLQHAQKEFTIPGMTLGARYDASPVICHDDTPPPPDAASVYVPTGKPGGRAPHAWLGDGSSLFDRFGFEWTLLRLGAGHSTGESVLEAARRRGLDLAVVDLEDEPEVLDLYGASLVLVRPDHIVAWRADAATPEEAEAMLSQVTGQRRHIEFSKAIA